MNFFSFNQIKPKGWMKTILQTQKNGLSGNLYKIWPDIKDSKWLGGNKEGWERLPYYLDGFIPLVYLLNDEEEKLVIKKYIDTILSHQQEDGWLCPCKKEERESYDLWGLFLILKVLIVYYECSNDERIEECIYKALKNLSIHLKAQTLFNWASARWFECYIPIIWIYNKRKEDWLLDLASRLKAQGLDYLSSSSIWKKTENVWSYETHVVNISMALKAEALYSTLFNKKTNNETKKLLKIIDKYHSNVYGHFNGDECLGGTSPTRGSELCGIVEAMYSYELLFLLTKDSTYLDRLDLLTFNGLPATISSDMWTHQYDQMINQIACVKFKKSPFGTNSNESNLFGLEPNFGCCTANFSQGWPKYLRSVILQDNNDLIITSCVPFALKNNDYDLIVNSEFPFRKRINIELKTNKKCTLKIRIPQNYEVNTSYKVENNYLTINVNEHVNFSFELIPLLKLEKRPSSLYSLKYGSLIFALPIKEKKVMHEYIKDGVERKFPYCDFEIFPLSNWKYGFTSFTNFEIIEKEYTNPFSRNNPPLQIKTSLAPIIWDEQDLICSDKPTKIRTNENEVKYLQPYGSTTLRVTELPFINK